MNLDAQSRKDEVMSLLVRIILRWMPGPGKIDTDIDGLFLSRKDEISQSSHCLSKPMAAFIVQGEKMMTLGTTEFVVNAGQCLITCVDMPSSTLLLHATPEHPFLSLGFFLNKKIMADLLSEVPPETHASRHSHMTACAIDAPLDLLETLLRLVDLLDKPTQISVLAPLILRELHYLLLSSPLSDMLHDIYMHGTRDNRIINAIAWLKNHIATPISVDDLAKMAHMSVSSLHRHFKSITGLSPLQYQKQLRLYEAQRLMLAENERADMAAMTVGYESVTQFNREYKRMFGEPPHRDIIRRKKNLPR